MSRSRSPRNGASSRHFNVGPAETALGFPTEVIDAHAYIMAPFDVANGIEKSEKLRRLQLELGTHHTYTMQTHPLPQRYVDNSSLVNQKTLSLQDGVEWSRDALGRPCWDIEGKRFVKGNCPPSVQTQGFAYSANQLVAAMDFSDVAMSVLHYYPSFGNLQPLHREACVRFPNRFRRLLHFPQLVRPPADMNDLLAHLDMELAAGGVAGFQFMTGWFEGDWDCEAMRPFWDHLSTRQVAVWFTCVLGDPRQFTNSADDLFVADYEKVSAWCKRYPDTDVVLTHGLPWRSFLHADQKGIGPIPDKLLKVFENPRVHLQLLVPLRLGDVFDFPFAEANGMLKQLADAVGVERLLYGTDMPMVERYCTYSQSILHIARYCTFLTAAQRALVLGGNARRLIDRADAAAKPSTSIIPSTLFAPSEVTISVPQAAFLGQKVEDLETPRLMVDLEAFDANCEMMNTILSDAGKLSPANQKVLLRPHCKNHKCSGLMKRQLRLHGALAQGVCCQTVREAEAMAQGGVDDVMLTNIIADMQKARRMATLAARGARVIVCVDTLEGLLLYKEALRTMPGSRIEVMIELGIACRTGVEPEDVGTTVAIAKDIETFDGLHLRGLQVYAGTAQHLRSGLERKEAIEKVLETTRLHIAALREAGIASTLVVSGGGTGTLPLELESGEYAELQCGSYVFNDADYSVNLDRPSWRQSLFVLGTVIGNYSRPGVAGGAHYVVDVGLKSVAFDSGAPVPHSPDGATMSYVNLGDEHGAVQLPEGSKESLPLGTRLWHVPGHCDPTVNLYEHIVGIRSGQVEEVFRVDGRGY